MGSQSGMTIALIGNPNVGKSTLFNELTGSHQHTGNWPGKTVESAMGHYTYKNQVYTIVDLPGTYSLSAHSLEEEKTREYISLGCANLMVVVCDATCLKRNLHLVFQIMELTDDVVICVNLCDEAKKKKIEIDFDKLQQLLGVPVLAMSAAKKEGIQEFKELISSYNSSNKIRICDCEMEEEERLKLYLQKAEEICAQTVSCKTGNSRKKDNWIDLWVTSPIFGTILMLLLLFGIFWLTIVGANIPSQWLSNVLFRLEELLIEGAKYLNLPTWLYEAVILGMYRVLAWVVSVMLPPMAIFFPLFTILEDFGYLPRVAFNMDGCFKRCGACGKQCLTMCMGLGCNAVGVTGCRIIDSKRERLIAILTNCFVPCNGRFPTIITLIMIFIASNRILATCSLVAVILIGILLTLVVSYVLSHTILKGEPSAFTLELPPYRKPQVGKVILRSVLDRTLFVLGRAILVAGPAGLVIWILSHTILNQLVELLQPLGLLMGLDGAILLAFLLGFPANEIVVPILLMIYLGSGSLVDFENTNALQAILISHGWTQKTAICMILFSLVHWPCSTTCITIWKETKSIRWTFASILIPTLIGVLLCISIAQIF